MHIMQSPPGPRTVFNGREMDYFCGCGYFGLQGHPELIESACQAARQYGIACSTSRNGHGNNPILLGLEEAAARFFQQEAALYYVSGYLGNMILLRGLADEYDAIFMDESSHYSVTDAVALTGKPCYRFAHRSADDLKAQLAAHLKPAQRPLVISDGIFPITGEVAPVNDYLEVLADYDGYRVCVDDAHALGAIGEQGRGTYEYLGLERGENLYCCGTLSKAFGGHGGIITGPAEFIEGLRRDSSIYRASSGVPNPAAAASTRALEIVGRSPELRRRLWDNVALLKDELCRMGFQLPDNPVPIVLLHSMPGTDLKGLAEALFAKDIVVSHRNEQAYTGVPAGGAIRIAVFATHTREQILRLSREIHAFMS